ncbi:unnamed protein product, partial [marine sediment metagenome]
MARTKRRTADRKANPLPRRMWRSLRLPKKPLFVLIAVVFAVAALLLSPPGRNLAGLEGGGSSSPTAAIIDQLGATYPNPDFADAAAETLEQAGYAVDYYPPEQITVE